MIHRNRAKRRASMAHPHYLVKSLSRETPSKKGVSCRFGRVIQQSRFTQQDQFQFPPPFKIKFYIHGSQCVANPKNSRYAKASSCSLKQYNQTSVAVFEFFNNVEISPPRDVRILGEGPPCDEILEGGASSIAYTFRGSA